MTEIKVLGKDFSYATKFLKKNGYTFNGTTKTWSGLNDVSFLIEEGYAVMVREASLTKQRPQASGRIEMSKTIEINGVAVAIPKNAVAYKYADPTDDARWIYDVAEAEAIKSEDCSLIVDAC